MGRPRNRVITAEILWNIPKTRCSGSEGKVEKVALIKWKWP